MYKIDISPSASSVLEKYSFRCAKNNGMECALRLLPSTYHVIIFWPHLWLVFQIKEYEKCILTAWPAFQTSR